MARRLSIRNADPALSGADPLVRAPTPSSALHAGTIPPPNERQLRPQAAARIDKADQGAIPRFRGFARGVAQGFATLILALIILPWSSAFALQVPAGTEIQIRLKSKVSTQSSKPKDKVEAV